VNATRVRSGASAKQRNRSNYSLELALVKIEANDTKPASLNTQKMREFGQDNIWSISSSEPRSEVQVEL